MNELLNGERGVMREKRKTNEEVCAISLLVLSDLASTAAVLTCAYGSSSLACDLSKDRY